MIEHKIYISRCIELAQQGIGNVSPNPMVGSVIIIDNKIVGEGFHQKCGFPHAEVNAIQSVSDHKLLENATLYVNLEPCSHHGKTPPCADLIISKKIPKVVIGALDPNPKVSGKGAQLLKDSGIEVTIGVQEDECKELNKRFYTFFEKKRPYIILKWAQTQDGFIDVNREALKTNRPTWITNELSRRLVHKWRAEEDAILVGTNTALKDNPSLNVRDWHGNNPLRLVLDKSLRLPSNLSLFDQIIPTIAFTEEKKESKPNLEYINLNFEKELPQQIINILSERNILSVIIEGGAITLQSFINSGLWDEARVFIGNQFFKKGIKAPEITAKLYSKDKLGDSELLIYKK